MTEKALESTPAPADGDPRALGWDERSTRGQGHYVVLLGALGALLALPVLRWLATPDARGYGTHEQLGLPPCTMMEVTGIPCPGCGVTTSISLAVHGHLVAAFLNQPFGLLVALTIPLFTGWAVWSHVAGRDLYRALTGRNASRWLVPAVALLLAAWVYKIVVTLAGHAA
jgi:Protein of unknown function (DUF2752)